MRRRRHLLPPPLRRKVREGGVDDDREEEWSTALPAPAAPTSPSRREVKWEGAPLISPP
jgi:hypothetical protein